MNPVAPPRGRRTRLICSRCATTADPRGTQCPRCGGVVVAQLDPLRRRPAPDRRAVGIWRYAELLPTTTATVSLGEGGTPLLPLPVGLHPSARVLIKLEGTNPTLSFKDRAMALAVSIARDRGCSELVVASTGNAAVSAAAYAAAAGLGCRVIVGSHSRAARKLLACEAYGAQVTKIEGDYSTAYAAAKSAESDRVMNVSTTYRNPVLAEAYRTVAAELVEDLGGAPSFVVVPIGAGPLLRGIAQGFADLLQCGAVDATPRMIGVQAESVSPLAQAWESGTTPSAWRESLARPVGRTDTVATAIADGLRGYEDQGLLTLSTVAATGGRILAVPEAGILRAHERLLAAGVWVEPSSATALAALNHLDVGPQETVVLLLTAHGIKASA